MRHNLKTDIARNKRIVAYILKQYPETNIYGLPLPVYTLVTKLQHDIDRAEDYMSSTAKK